MGRSGDGILGKNPGKLSIAECSNKTEGKGGEPESHERVLQKDVMTIVRRLHTSHEADSLRPQGVG